MRQRYAFEVPPTLAIANGATTPNPGAAGVLVWSSITSALMLWGGSSWSIFSGAGAGSVGFNAGAWQAPVYSATNSRIATWKPIGNSATTPGLDGMLAATSIGATTARVVALTNAMTREGRIGYVSAATAGSLASWRHTVGQMALGNDSLGGFFWQCTFGVSDAAAVAGARMFIGLSTNTAAATNVEPSSLTNCIGVGHGAADTNLKLYITGTAASTVIDLGTNFPTNTLSTDIYQLSIFSPRDITAKAYKVGWCVKRIGTSFQASGVSTGAFGTQVPANTLLLNPNMYRTNNATALSVGLDLGVINQITEL